MSLRTTFTFQITLAYHYTGRSNGWGALVLSPPSKPWDNLFKNQYSTKIVNFIVFLSLHLLQIFIQDFWSLFYYSYNVLSIVVFYMSFKQILLTRLSITVWEPLSYPIPSPKHLSFTWQVGSELATNHSKSY